MKMHDFCGHFWHSFCGPFQKSRKCETSCARAWALTQTNEAPDSSACNDFSNSWCIGQSYLTGSVGKDLFRQLCPEDSAQSFTIDSARLFLIDSVWYFPIGSAEWFPISSARYFRICSAEYFPIDSANYFPIDSAESFPIDSARYFLIDSV